MTSVFVHDAYVDLSELSPLESPLQFIALPVLAVAAFFFARWMDSRRKR